MTYMCFLCLEDKVVLFNYMLSTSVCVCVLHVCLVHVWECVFSLCVAMQTACALMFHRSDSRNLAGRLMVLM